MSNIMEESERLRQALTPLIKSVVDEKTRDCFRVYKAQVVSAPNPMTKKCVVRLVGESENTSHSIAYSSAVSNVEKDDYVWVGLIYSSWINAIVWQKIDFS